MSRGAHQTPSLADTGRNLKQSTIKNYLDLGIITPINDLGNRGQSLHLYLNTDRETRCHATVWVPWNYYDERR